MITVKSTASFTKFRKEILLVMVVVDDIYASHGLTAEITCGTDNHKSTDPHPNGFANDYGTHNVPLALMPVIHKELVDRLGSVYTVLYCDKNIQEAVYPKVDLDRNPQEHFHIQVRLDIWHKIAGI